MIPLPLKFQSFRIAAMYIFLLKNKFLSFANLSLFLHDHSIFWLETGTSGSLSLYLLKLKRPVLKVHLPWCKTGIYNHHNLCKKVFLMLNIHFQFDFFAI